MARMAVAGSAMHADSWSGPGSRSILQAISHHFAL
jgi:hypothetical protein